MSLSIYQAAFPYVLRTLNALSDILDKAAAHCEARKIDPAQMLAYRLAPDMFDLKRQVQIVTDQAKGMAARLGGVEIPSYADDETSIADLKARIAKTVDFLGSISEAQVAGSEDRQVSVKTRAGELTFSGRDYLFGFMLPNFYFHAATAYGILRHAGVELGKSDFLARK
ncbi:MAG: DUF1993 domain-containing protein [Rhodomicrobium sp.]|nr:DUF1993 domain-containing protein [Rhodomicrobium sp.]